MSTLMIGLALFDLVLLVLLLSRGDKLGSDLAQVLAALFRHIR